MACPLLLRLPTSWSVIGSIRTMLGVRSNLSTTFCNYGDLLVLELCQPPHPRPLSPKGARELNSHIHSPLVPLGVRGLNSLDLLSPRPLGGEGPGVRHLSFLCQVFFS